MSASAAAKRKQDEKNSKLIRELAALPDNRFCFECGQRGPTYVNITEGSFCCSTCSGLLRGLNPPHRVKSISMATFSTEEIEKIKRTGNAENKKTWLGLFEGGPPKYNSREEMQLFLVKKYEKQAWYVSEQERREQAVLLEAACQSASSAPNQPRPQPQPDILADPFSDAFSMPVTKSASGQNQSTEKFYPAPEEFAPPLPKTTSQPRTTAQLVDPFASIPQLQPTLQPDLFSQFDDLFGASLTLNSKSSTTTQAQSIPSQQQHQPQQHQTKTMPVTTVAPATDRYSDLADLDLMFNSSASTVPATWSSSSAFGTAPIRPANGANPFGQAPAVAPTPAAIPTQAWPNPFVAAPGASNPFAMPKSCTFGAFGSARQEQPTPSMQQTFASNDTLHNPFMNPFNAGAVPPRPQQSQADWNPFT